MFNFKFLETLFSKTYNDDLIEKDKLLSSTLKIKNKDDHIIIKDIKKVYYFLFLFVMNLVKYSQVGKVIKRKYINKHFYTTVLINLYQKIIKDKKELDKVTKKYIEILKQHDYKDNKYIKKPDCSIENNEIKIKTLISIYKMFLGSFKHKFIKNKSSYNIQIIQIYLEYLKECTTIIFENVETKLFYTKNELKEIIKESGKEIGIRELITKKEYKHGKFYYKDILEHIKNAEKTIKIVDLAKQLNIKPKRIKDIMVEQGHAKYVTKVSKTNLDKEHKYTRFVPLDTSVFKNSRKVYYNAAKKIISDCNGLYKKYININKIAFSIKHLCNCPLVQDVEIKKLKSISSIKKHIIDLLKEKGLVNIVETTKNVAGKVFTFNKVVPVDKSKVRSRNRMTINCIKEILLPKYPVLTSLLCIYY